MMDQPKGFPYFIPIQFASVTAGATMELPANVRNNTGRAFVVTSIGIHAPGGMPFGVSLRITTGAHSFMTSRIRIGTVAPAANPVLELPREFVLNPGIEITGTAENLGGSTDTLNITLIGYLETKTATAKPRKK